jgi:PAS domain S-box-containing protein
VFSIPKVTSPKSAALLISTVYALFGVLWIFTTDYLVGVSFRSAPQLAMIQSGKGLMFVLASAVLIAGLVFSMAKRVERQNQLIENGLDTLGDSFYIIDQDGEFIQLNQIAHETLGYSQSEFEEMSIEELFVPEHEERIRRSIQTVLEEGEDRVEADVLTKDGTKIPVEFRGRQYTDEQGDIVGVVGIGRDLSKLHNRNMQLQIVDHFLRHNIRHSLNIIEGNAGFLADDSTAENDRFDRITEECNQLLEQLEKHRRIVNIFTGKHSPAEIDISSIVRKAVSEKRQAHPTANIKVSTPSEVTLVTESDFSEVINELLENAIEHNEDDAIDISVEVRQTADSVDIEVSDSGPGMSGTERAVLNGEVKMDQLNHGSGIGLWLVYWNVKLARGEFEITDLESGTRVCVRIPRDHCPRS